MCIESTPRIYSVTELRCEVIFRRGMIICVLTESDLSHLQTFNFVALPDVEVGDTGKVIFDGSRVEFVKDAT